MFVYVRIVFSHCCFVKVTIKKIAYKNKTLIIKRYDIYKEYPDENLKLKMLNLIYKGFTKFNSDIIKYYR